MTFLSNSLRLACSILNYKSHKKILRKTTKASSSSSSITVEKFVFVHPLFAYFCVLVNPNGKFLFKFFSLRILFFDNFFSYLFLFFCGTLIVNDDDGVFWFGAIIIIIFGLNNY
jgi:hypothetical protein